MSRASDKTCPVFFAFLLHWSASGLALSQTGPPDFLVENPFPTATFNLPVQIVFFPDGRKLVVEKEGRVWTIATDGTKLPTPFIDLSAKVLSNDDRGLHGVALDPDFPVNRWVYMLYTADPDSDGADDNVGAFARLERYRTNIANPDITDLSTRQILIGGDWSSGIPEPPRNRHHMVGTLRFGSDKTLLIGAGDAANADMTDAGGTDPLSSYGPGRIDPAQDIGAFRAQTLNSLDGKILRVDKETGAGLSSNPYWNGNPTSSRSRVWLYGLRNPFRFSRRPGTGSTDPSLGQPGVLYIGDVGWNAMEELEIARQGGANYGWPCIEGPDVQSSYAAVTSTYWPNANVVCSASPNAENPQPKTPPALWWDHGSGSNSYPPGLTGNCVIGGVFYSGTSYPAAWQNRYYMADYGAGWIKSVQVNANDSVLSVNDFFSNAGGIVDIESDPATGDLYYIDLNMGAVRRIRYESANHSPVVNASLAPTSGYEPLTVAMTASASTDPDGDSLSYTWAPGNGFITHTSDTSYTYMVPGTYTAVVTVSDGHGGNSVAAFQVVVGQIPPPGNILMPITKTFFSQNQTVPLQATAVDTTTVSATYRWDIDLVHDNHIHPATETWFGLSTAFIPVTPDDGQQYHFRIRLSVTQAALTSFDTTDIYPLLNVQPVAISVDSAYQVTTRIKSAGEVGSPVSAWEMREGSTLLASGILDPIPNGDSLDVVATVGPLTFGQHTIRVVIDPSNTLFETNESDNEISGVANAPGLVAAYSFNEGAGTAIADVTGHGVTGTNSGAAWTTQGKYGNGLSFDGVSSYVDLGNPSLLQMTGSMSWSAWVKAFANPADDGQIISKSDGSSGWQFKSSPDTGPHTFGVAVSGNGFSHTQRYSTTVRSLNTWYYVAGVYNAGAQTLDIYVNGIPDNGVLVGTVPASQFATNINANIGRRSGGYYFDGIIDEVRVYNRALTQSEIQQDMNTPLGTSLVSSALQVQSGWNLLSLPVVPNDSRTPVVFPTATSSAFRFGPAGYTQEDTLRKGPGYWLKFNSLQTVLITGTVVQADTFDVTGGWNLIGTITNPVPVNSVTTQPPGIIVSPFFRYQSGYAEADTLFPGQGYWIKTSQNGQLILH